MYKKKLTLVNVKTNENSSDCVSNFVSLNICKQIPALAITNVIANNFVSNFSCSKKYTYYNWIKIIYFYIFQILSFYTNSYIEQQIWSTLIFKTLNILQLDDHSLQSRRQFVRNQSLDTVKYFQSIVILYSRYLDK